MRPCASTERLERPALAIVGNHHPVHLLPQDVSRLGANASPVSRCLGSPDFS